MIDSSIMNTQQRKFIDNFDRFVDSNWEDEPVVT